MSRHNLNEVSSYLMLTDLRDSAGKIAVKNNNELILNVLADPMVCVDQNYLKQLMLNIVTGVSDAITKGKIILTVDSEYSSTTKSVVFSVQGIPGLYNNEKTNQTTASEGDTKLLSSINDGDIINYERYAKYCEQLRGSLELTRLPESGIIITLRLPL